MQNLINSLIPKLRRRQLILSQMDDEIKSFKLRQKLHVITRYCQDSQQ